MSPIQTSGTSFGPTWGGAASGTRMPQGTVVMAPMSTPPQPPFQIGPSTITQPSNIDPNSPGMGIIVDPGPAPSQQPPPPGLPAQPELQPGVQVTNVEPSSGYAVPKFFTAKLGLAALGALLGGAAVGVVISRRRKAAAAG